jgi:hypothetical protein
MNRLAWLGASVLLAVGCADDRPRTAPVEGVVTYLGKPVPNGTVVFVPESGPSATGEIGPDGRYQLTTFTKGDGAVPGPHRVMIAALDDMKDRLPEDRSPLPPPIIPTRYSDYRASGLTADVQTTRNSINFALEGALR